MITGDRITRNRPGVHEAPLLLNRAGFVSAERSELIYEIDRLYPAFDPLDEHILASFAFDYELDRLGFNYQLDLAWRHTL